MAILWGDMLELHKFLLHCQSILRKHFSLLPTYLFVLIWCSVIPDLTPGSPAFMPCHCLRLSLLSGLPGWSKLILSSLCPSPAINHSSKDPWYLLVEKLFSKQDVGPWFATGVSWLFGSLGRHSHISALTYIFEGLCVCQNLKFQSDITGLMLAFHLLICVSSSTNLEKTGFHYWQYIYCQSIFNCQSSTETKSFQNYKSITPLKTNLLMTVTIYLFTTEDVCSKYWVQKLLGELASPSAWFFICLKYS